MIDFNNASFLKLKPVKNETFSSMIAEILVDGEEIIQSFQSVRDGVVFTTKRIFAINVQGITGKKKDFTSLPYSRIQCFSVETAGVLDLDSELELWFSGLGKVRFEFLSNADVKEICRAIGGFVLK
ncbi:PH domain-containing protein [uncultured Ruthenibacterium sp.]|uniref:PH domain-containing protein n=1 Tax=uncultured Ruthenibacterium sp. TaxID=1905347 RepID=UPI00349EBB32